MIYGIGTDICNIDRIKRSLEKQGQRFAARVLTTEELENDFAILTTLDMQARMLAKRWSVKEAIAKALGTGIGKQFSFQDAIISHDELGKPILSVQSRVFKNFPDISIHISISDEMEFCTAFAVCEIRN